MSIWDVFTGDGYQDEANRISEFAKEIEDKYGTLQTDLSQASLSELERLIGAGVGSIEAYGGSAANALTGYGDLSLGALGSAYTGARNDLQGYGNLAAGQINSGRDAAIRDLDAMIPILDTYYQPYMRSGSDATSMYSNAMGLNGKAGNAAATGAFQASPGYTWQRDQATDAASRQAAALGIGGSGNTLSALSELGSNLANQEWGSWMDRLSGLSSQGMSAVNSYTGQMGGLQSAKAGINYQQGTDQANLLAGLGTGLADLGTTYGNNVSNVYNNMGTNLGNLYAGMGSDIASMYGTQATAQDDIRTGLANSLTGLGLTTANMINAANTNATQADAEAGANLFGAILSPFEGIFGDSDKK